MRSLLAERWGALVVFGFALLSALVAAQESHAATGTAAVGPAGFGVIVKTANSAQFVYGGNALPDISRAYGLVGTAGDVAARDIGAVRSIPGTPVVTVSRIMSKGAIAKAGAVALRSLPVVATGLALWDIYDSIRVHPDGSGGLLRDLGAPATTVPQVAWQPDSGGPAVSSPDAAMRADAAIQRPGRSFNYCEVSVQTATRASGYCTFKIGTFGDSVTTSASKTIASLASCPASIDPGNAAYDVPAGQAPMADGNCRTARGYHTPVEPDAVVPILDSFPSVQFSPDTVRDIVDRGSPIEVSGPVSVTGPTTTPGTSVTTTTTGPGGSPGSTTVTNTTNNYHYDGDTITYDTSNTTTNPDGSTTTTTGDKEIKTCGLPGTPPCKLDETGTATAENPDERDARDAWDKLKMCATNPASCVPPLPSVNWNFQLPTYCGPIPLPAFAPFLSEINICPFQPMFHDVMGVVWVIGGLLGAVGLFWRDQMGIN
jgi:hypothetical protein